MTTEQIIKAIEVIAERDGIACATVTKRLCDNSRLYQRLVSGADCTISTGRKILEEAKKKANGNNDKEGAAA